MREGAHTESVRSERFTALWRELEALPENKVGEIVAGELHVSPRPALEHAFAIGGLVAALLGPFGQGIGGPGGWWILPGPELHLGEDVLVPDLAGWQRERLGSPCGASTSVAPDWLCEVRSPSTARLDRVRKLPRYATHGVERIWFVDPGRRMLESLRRAGAAWVIEAVHGEEEPVRLEPFSAMELQLGRLWVPD